MRRRVVLAAGVVVIAVVAAVAGWFFGRQSVSPQEAAAQAGPPEASLITVPVVSKQLVSELVVRGTAAPAGRTELLVVASESSLPVVTAIPVDTDSVVEVGDVVIEVAERPVFALSGELPAFRELRLDARGDDVAQLEDSLLTIGAIERADDLLDTDTAEAIAALYSAAGYETPDGADGVVLPLSEFVFVSGLPRVVDEVLVERGDLVVGPVMRVASSDVEVTAQIAAADRNLVEEGMAAAINVDDLDLVVPGTVTELGDRPIEGSGGNYRIVVRPDSDTDADRLAGALTRVVMPIESSDGDVLVVPVAALSAGPDGAARVEVEQADGTTVLVAVTTGLTSGGEVAVAPINANELTDGDRVVVGA